MKIVNIHNLVLAPKLTGMKLFVLNSSSIYCSIMFEDCIESTQLMKCYFEVLYIKFENIFTATEFIFLPTAPT
jgi:hypothetical protein